MLFPKTALLYGILLAILLEPISGRMLRLLLKNAIRNHRNNPKSGGLSEGGYPSSSDTNEYLYIPPEQIIYPPVHEDPPVNYPVYRGNPPNYVYQYIDSGSKYGTLLAGLALLNLGTPEVDSAAYENSQDEVCKFAVKYDNGDYEETKIDCNIISSFILQDQMMTSSEVVTTTTTKTTVVDALDVKGAPVTVTPGMNCYVMRTSPTSNMRKSVPCGLLQTYVDESIYKSSAARNAPMFTITIAILAFCLAY